MVGVKGAVTAVAVGVGKSAIGAVPRAGKAVMDKIVSPKGNGVEDEVREKAHPEVNHNDMKETEYGKEELAKLAEKLSLTDNSKQKGKQEILVHTKDAETVLGGKPTPNSINQGENLDDMGGVQPKVENKENITDKLNVGEKETVKENTNESKNSEYEDKMLKDIRTKKIAEKDPSEDIRDAINRGIAGIAGGVKGAAMGTVGGAFMAGLTGENKAIPTGAIGGAEMFAKMQVSDIDSANARMTKNIKMLVNNNIQNNNIIKNAAELGTKRNLSEGQTLQIAKLAEAFPDLKKDTKTQKMLEQKWNEMGLNQKDIKRTVSDIIKVQTKSASANSAEKKEKDLNKKIDELISQVKKTQS